MARLESTRHVSGDGEYHRRGLNDVLFGESTVKQQSSPTRERKLACTATAAAADCPGPWLRTWIEFQIEARINQALREFTEGLEFAGFMSHGQVNELQTGGRILAKGPVVSEDCSLDVGKVAKAHAGLLTVVEGLVSEVSQLSPVLAMVPKMEATFEDVRSLRTELVTQRDAFRCIRAESEHSREMLVKLATMPRCMDDISERLQVLERQIPQVRREALDRIVTETGASDAKLERLAHDLQSSASLRGELEVRLDHFDGRLTTIAETHARYDKGFERIAKELAISSDAWDRIAQLEGKLAGLADSHVRREGLCDRLASEQRETLTQVRSNLDHVEHEQLSLANVQERTEARLTHMASGLVSMVELQQRLERVECEVLLSAEDHSKHHRRFEILDDELTASKELSCRLQQLENQSSYSTEAQTRLAQIELEFASMVETIRKYDGSIGCLRDNAAAALEMLRKLEDRVEECSVQSVRHGERHQQLEQRLVQTHDGHGQLNERLEDVLATHSGQQDKLDCIERELSSSLRAIDKHEGRLEGKLALMAAQQEKLEHVEHECASMLQAQNQHEKNVDHLRHDLATCVDAHSKHATAIERLHRELELSATARNQINELTDELEAVGGRTSVIEGTLSALPMVEHRVSCVEEKQLGISAEHLQQYGHLEQEMATIARSQQTHEQHLVGLDRKMTAAEHVQEARIRQLEEELTRSAELHEQHENRLGQQAGDHTNRHMATQARIEVIENSLASATELHGDHTHRHMATQARIEAIESSVASATALHGRHEGRLDHLDREVTSSARLHAQTERLEREFTALTEGCRGFEGRLEQFGSELADNAAEERRRQERLARDIATSTEAHRRHDGRFCNLSEELAVLSEINSRTEQLEREQTVTLQSRGRLETRLAEFKSDLSGAAVRSEELEGSLEQLRLDCRRMDFDRRLKQILSDVQRRVDEAKHEVIERLEACKESMEQDLTAAQRRSAAELRVEVRTAIRNEAAAVAALDEQLWLTDQRLGQRIDELVHVHHSYGCSASISRIEEEEEMAQQSPVRRAGGSGHETTAAQQQGSPPTGLRPIPPTPLGPRRAAAGQSVDSEKTGTSENDVQSVSSKELRATSGLTRGSALNMASLAAEALSEKTGTSENDVQAVSRRSVTKGSALNMASLAAEALTKDLNLRLNSGASVVGDAEREPSVVASAIRRRGLAGRRTLSSAKIAEAVEGTEAGSATNSGASGERPRDRDVSLGHHDTELASTKTTPEKNTESPQIE